MCILKGFSRFVVNFDVQNGFFFNLSPLNITVSRKVISFSDVSAVNFALQVRTIKNVVTYRERQKQI